MNTARAVRLLLCFSMHFFFRGIGMGTAEELTDAQACQVKSEARRRHLLCLYAEKDCAHFSKPATYAMRMSGYYPRDRYRCTLITSEPEFESLAMAGTEVCSQAGAFSNVYGASKFQAMCRAAAQAMAHSGL